MNNVIKIDNGLYEVHCLICDVILAILEIPDDELTSHPSLCENDGINDNNTRWIQQHSV